MKILWLVNVKLPEVSYISGEKPQPYGGWLTGASIQLSMKNDVELAICFPELECKTINRYEGDKIFYYGFRKIFGTNSSILCYEKLFDKIIMDFKPDLVHVFGTEFSHSLSMVNVCKNKDIVYVLSIQGLVSQISEYYYSDLPFRVIYGYSIRNIIKGDPLFVQKKEMTKRGNIEIETINKTQNIIGRTTWDKACIERLNPKASYFHCNEILRNSFYENKWNYDDCRKYSIFLVQGQTPIKGLHYVLHALSIVIKDYPEMKLFICGYNNINKCGVIDKFKVTNYEKYIEKLIKRFKLGSSINFLGKLDEKEMVSMYLKSNIFICSSSIENSSNSLSEAMLIGVPCIASYVGGVPDLLEHKEEGFLYQHNDSTMLSYYIKRIFQDSQLAKKMSRKARLKALLINDRAKNTDELINIYNKISVKE